MADIVVVNKQNDGTLAIDQAPGFNTNATNAAVNKIFNSNKQPSPCFPSKPNQTDISRTSISVLLPPDWTTLDLTDPYFDPGSNNFLITVPTEYNAPPPDQLDRIMEEAKEPGIKALLKVYGRENTPENVQILIQTARSVDWFIPDRPNPTCAENGQLVPLFGMKVHVALSASVFDTIPLEQNLHVGETLPLASNEITFISNELKGKIKDASTTIKKFADDAANVQGSVVNINLQKEADRMTDFYSVLQNLLIANGFVIRQDQADLIIIGLNEQHKVLYVLFDDGINFLRLFGGFDNFIKTKPASSDRTMLFLSKLGSLQRLGQKTTSVGLVDFLHDFVARPPSISLSFGSPNPFAFAAAPGVSDIISKANSKSVKTEADKQAEDRLISSSNLKHSMTANLKNKEFVGDPVLDISSFGKTLQSVNSLEDVYEDILNKVSVKSIIQLALKCLPIPDPCMLAKAFLASLACEEFISIYENVVGPIINIPALQLQVRDDLKSCLEDTEESERTFLLGRIQFKAGIPIQTVDETDRVPLEILFDALGAKAKNILKNLCDDPRIKKLIMDAIPFDVCDLFDIKIPDIDIPTLNFPDLIPTIDIMAEMILRLEAAILDALISTIITMIKNIIVGILENCGDIKDVNFGLSSIPDLLGQSLDLSAQGIEAVTNKFLGDLNLSVGKIGLLGKDLIGLFEDSSSLMSPTEISNLLNGDASNDVVKLVQCLVSNKYPNLKDILETPAKIEDLFQSFGNLVNKQLLLDQIAQRSDVLGTVKDVCDEPDDSGRRKLLGNKGLTPEQVDFQVAKANKRKADRLNNLLNLLHKPNLLDGVVPPVFCQGNNPTSQGIIDRDHPSFKFMLDKVVNTVYDGVHMSFNQEISTFPVVIKEGATIQKPRDVPRKITFNGIDIPNPEFQRLISQGVAVEKPEDLDKGSIKVYEDQSFVSSDVAKGLKGNLENFVFDKRLFSFNATNGQVSLNIPTALDTTILTPPPADLIGKLFSSTSALLSGSTDLFNSVQDQIGKLQLTSNTIEYILPTNPLNNKIDQFNVIIEEVNSAQTEPTELFHTSGSNEIPQDILTFIQDNNLNTLPNTSLPQSYFSSFVVNIWDNGANIYENGIKKEKPEYAEGVGNSSNIDVINGTFRNKVKTDVYSGIFEDILGAIARQTAQSPMFNSKVLSLVNFTPDKMSNGCKPHLLDIESIKNKMKDDYNKSKCIDDVAPSVDGLGKDKMNALEQSGVSSAVVTFIRLITIENILKSIFVFSEFKIEDVDHIDDVVLSYLTESIKNEISLIATNTNDPNFNQQYIEQVLFLFNEKVTNGEVSGETTTDVNVALNELIREQVVSVMKRMNAVLGTQGNVDFNKIMVQEWLPLFDVADGSLRLAANNLTNLGKNNTLSIRKDYQTAFNLENGTLILEKYVRIKEKNTINNNSQIQINRQRFGDSLYGVSNIQDFDNFIQNSLRPIDFYQLPANNPLGIAGDRIHFENEFDSWSYGLRLVYVPPITNNDFTTKNQTNITLGQTFTPVFTIEGHPLTTGVFTDGSAIKTKNATKLDKAFKVFEGNNVSIDGVIQNVSQVTTSREIHSFPIVSVEITETDIANFTTNDSINDKWNSLSQQLQDALIKTPEYNFMFRFCFPINRMMSLIMLYSITYMSNIKKLKDLFNGTKAALKVVFQALLNSGNYQYEDHGVNQLGGNAGINTTIQNNTNTSPSVPGVSLASMAARTGWLILKGLTEKVDPVISRARVIVDGAKLVGKDISMLKASIAQLPCNIFPPPPIGPGIGPPLTPLGFIYLASDLDSLFHDAETINQDRSNVGADFNINLNNQVCDDKDT